MRKIKAAVLGMGFIGVSHVEAIRRIGSAQMVAVADTNYELAKSKAEQYNISKCYETVEQLLADDEIDVIHNCTPNFLHTEINKKIIEAGKHVFSEKPLAMTHEESDELLAMLKERPQIVHGVNFCYRMNPLVLDMKEKVNSGEIGKPLVVHGSYLQDWLLFDTDYNWRVEPEIGGKSRCIGDIGSHWMDCVQNITGAKITDVCADIVIAHPIRKKPTGAVETFSLNKSTDYEEKQVTTEDYAAVLIKMDNGAHGVFYVSEISAGRKCRLDFEIDCELASMYWNQETSDQMWMGYRDEYNRHVMRNPLLMDKNASDYSYLAAGHPEGWNDAMKNNVQSYYNFILEGKQIGTDDAAFATFYEGHYITLLTEAILKSGSEKRWVSVEQD
ncbi:MAG: Gfo/Idh/MocA family oxidoreductase [Clostridia bacterium]|jgi:predicted dehydrogenase|nr:Gfo/Idh/MocA family oxidoreductase [Clostridia bacterium]